ncbi:MAG: flagellar export chaperone FliS [Desulfobacter sp.]|nr:MAG: flagellar export chaperone FliS [Desulfobacter sp.]
MAAYQQVNNYLTNYYEGMTPEQLILLLFNGALNRLTLTKEGIIEKDAKKKGENLSKAIAIISELNASVDASMEDESTIFLRGLYTAILTELPKVTLNNDLTTLGRAHRYITRLKEIWESDVMCMEKKSKENTQAAKPAPAASAYAASGGNAKDFRSISV